MTELLILHNTLVHDMTVIKETLDRIVLLIDPLIVQHTDLTVVLDTGLVPTLETINFQKTFLL